MCSVQNNIVSLSCPFPPPHHVNYLFSIYSFLAATLITWLVHQSTLTSVRIRDKWWFAVWCCFPVHCSYQANLFLICSKGPSTQCYSWLITKPHFPEFALLRLSSFPFLHCYAHVNSAVDDFPAQNFSAMNIPCCQTEGDKGRLRLSIQGPSMLSDKWSTAALTRWPC